MPETITAPEPGADKKNAPSGGETVTVACKLPNGLVLRNFVMEKVTEPVLGGGVRETSIARQVGAEYTLHGNAVNLTEIGKGNLPNHQIAGGFALTTGVPRDFWEKWLEDNSASAIVRNSLVFAHRSDSRGMAVERSSLKSGLEPLDPDNLPGDMRGIRKFNAGASDADNI